MPIVPNLLERVALLQLNLGPGPLLDLLGGAAFRAATVAAKLGVFEALNAGPLSAGEVAARLRVDEHALTRLLEFLAAAGYIRQSGTRYRNSAMTRRWLRHASQQDLSAWFQLWEGVISDFWDRLAEAVQLGHPSPHMHEWLEQHPGGWDVFNAAMRQLARQSADEIAAKAAVPATAQRLLDVGGSHGLNSVAFCRRYPQLTATVLDLPQALESAAETVVAEGMSERVLRRAGDFTRDDLGTGYDVALLFNVIHYNSAAANEELVRAVASALVPGGMIVIVDQLAGAAPTPTAEAFFHLLALNYVTGLGGDLYAFDQIVRWCARAGFGPLRRRALRSAPGASLITARKRPLESSGAGANASLAVPLS